jgi:AraC-like DNA-binding protein
MRVGVLPDGSSSSWTAPLWPPVLAARGAGGSSSGHAHHALHLVVVRPPGQQLRCRVEVDGHSVEHRARGIIVGADVVHAIDAVGCDVLLVFFDPESDVGSVLARGLVGPVRVVDDAVCAALADEDPFAIMSDAHRFGARLQALLGMPAGDVRVVHPGVRRALAHLKSLDVDDDASLAALAAVAGVSTGRFMHVFTESVGVPLRSYVLWLKLQRAAALLARGAAVTEAAHAAGFADGAHLTRSFWRMFGMRPSDIVAAMTTPAST